nr:hypothetical protein [Vibrio mediterranei]
MHPQRWQCSRHPIEATVFNFGKNGIAGTAIMRNSKIIQSAGVAGILTGLWSATQSQNRHFDTVRW